MRTQPIKIPRPNTPARFTVPLVEGIDEHAAMKDFDTYTQVLKAWGFEQAMATQSIGHDRISSARQAERIEDYQVWLHPAGVYANLHSYTHGGYHRGDGTEVPQTKALGSISLYACVDLGTGGELQHRAAVGIRGSGGTDPQFDGSSIRSISDTVHSNTGTSLTSFFRMIQEHGRLLPFERWPADQKVFYLPLPGEIIAPITQVEAGQTLADVLANEGSDIDILREAALSALPQALATLVGLPEGAKTKAEIQRKAEARGSGAAKGLRWDPLEFTIDEFSECLFLAGKRWPKLDERALLSHWSRVALGEFGDRLDPDAMRAFEAGPAGLSLATALLYAKSTAGAAAGLLEQLLEQAPTEVLTRWATEPDAAGYTLALRAVARSFTERNLDTHAPPAVDVLGILYRRLGPEGIVLATPTRSLMGLPVAEAQTRRIDNGHSKMLNEFAETVIRLDSWGLDWQTHLRWRNYPNLFKKAEGKPAFFQIDGPVEPARWRELLGATLTAGLGPVMALIERRRLEQDTPAVTTGRTGPRIRL